MEGSINSRRRKLVASVCVCLTNSMHAVSAVRIKAKEKYTKGQENRPAFFHLRRRNGSSPSSLTQPNDFFLLLQCTINQLFVFHTFRKKGSSNWL